VSGRERECKEWRVGGKESVRERMSEIKKKREIDKERKSI
jgi:hypothetical protein